jgi:hypothetical protein
MRSSRAIRVGWGVDKDLFVERILHFEPWRLSAGLMMVALALWFFSVYSAKLVLDDWGLIHALPLHFFVGLTLLTAGSALLWSSSQDHGILLSLQLCIFIGMLWFTPVLMGSSLVTTRYLFGYHTLTQYIVRYGHLNPAELYYHNWPAFNVLGTALVEVLNIKNPSPMLDMATLLMQFVILLSLVVLFRNTIGPENHSWAAIWLFFLFNYTGLTSFAPQGLALVLLLLLIAVVTKASAPRGSTGLAHQVVNILMLVSLTITHLLTSLASVFILATLWLTKRLKPGRLVILFAALIAVWTVYQARGYLETYTPIVARQAFRIDLLWHWNITNARATGSEGHQGVVNIRILLAALMTALGLAGLGLSRWHKKEADATALSVAGGILLFLPFGFYGGELVSRAYEYVLPVLAYFAIKLLRTRASAFLLLILLVIALPLSIVALHGNQALEYVSSSQKAYWNFLQDKTIQGRLTGGGMVWGWKMDYVGRQIYDPGIHAPSMEQGRAWREALFTGKWPPEGETAYVGLSAYEEALYKIGYGDVQFVPRIRSWLNNSSYYDRIYASGDVVSYTRRGARF